MNGFCKTSYLTRFLSCHFVIMETCLVYNFSIFDGFVLAQILKTTRRGGNVLLAIDTAGRVLELTQLLVSSTPIYAPFLLSCAVNLAEIKHSIIIPKKS